MVELKQVCYKGALKKSMMKPFQKLTHFLQITNVYHLLLRKKKLTRTQKNFYINLM